MSSTDVSLLDRLRARPDEAGWQRFVRLYDPLIRSWLRRSDLATADVDDLTQEVLTVVFRELPRFEHSQRAGAFRAWLRAVAVHRVRDFLRRQATRTRAVGGSDIVQQLAQLEDPHSELSKLWDQEHDRHVLAHLFEQVRGDFQPQTWQAFQGVVAGSSPAEVAARLGLSVNAVLLARSRVLARLRQEARGLVD